MTFRFETELEFIELDQIQSPFDLALLYDACDKKYEYIGHASTTQINILD